MSCLEIQDNLSAYLDGELSAEAARAVEQHVEECAVCRDLLTELRSVTEVLGSMPHEQAPRGLSEDIQIHLERRMLLSPSGEDTDHGLQTDRRLARERQSIWPRVVAIAACLMLAAGIVLLTKLPPGQGDKAGTDVVRVADKSSGSGPLYGNGIAATGTEPKGGPAADGSFAREKAFAQDARDLKDVADGHKYDSDIEAGTRGGREDVEPNMRKEVGGTGGETDAIANGCLDVSEVRRDLRSPIGHLGTSRYANGGELMGVHARLTDDFSGVAANALVLEFDGDLRTGQAELKKVLDRNQLVADRLGDGDTLAKSSRQYQVTSGESSLKRREAAGETAVFYVVEATPEQVARLTYDVAGSTVLRVRPESRGAFVHASTWQELRGVAAQRQTEAARFESVSKAAAMAPRPEGGESAIRAARTRSSLDDAAGPGDGGGGQRSPTKAEDRDVDRRSSLPEKNVVPAEPAARPASQPATAVPPAVTADGGATGDVREDKKTAAFSEDPADRSKAKTESPAPAPPAENAPRGDTWADDAADKPAEPQMTGGVPPTERVADTRKSATDSEVTAEHTEAPASPSPDGPAADTKALATKPDMPANETRKLAYEEGDRTASTEQEKQEGHAPVTPAEAVQPDKAHEAESVDGVRVGKEDTPDFGQKQPRMSLTDEEPRQGKHAEHGQSAAPQGQIAPCDEVLEAAAPPTEALPKEDAGVARFDLTPGRVPSVGDADEQIEPAKAQLEAAGAVEKGKMLILVRLVAHQQTSGVATEATSNETTSLRRRNQAAEDARDNAEQTMPEPAKQDQPARTSE